MTVGDTDTTPPNVVPCFPQLFLLTSIAHTFDAAKSYLSTVREMMEFV